MSGRRSDIAKEIVLAMIAKARPCARIETMLPGVLTVLGVISRELKELEEQEYAALRKLFPPVVESPRRRAKPYRVDGVETLPRPRIPGTRSLSDREESSQSSNVLVGSKNGRKLVGVKKGLL